MTEHCPHCGSASGDAEWCDHCGAFIPSATPKRPWLTEGELVELPIDRSDLPPQIRSSDPKKSGDGVPEVLHKPSISGDLPAIESGPLRVMVEQIREAYAQRRVWRVKDLDMGMPYVLEERKLATDENAKESCVLSEIDPLSRRLLFNPYVRMLRHDRVLTLFEAPRGQSLEAWRRNVGQKGATPSSILGMMRSVFRAVEEMHAGNLLHLGLNPRTIWFKSDNIGFTGADRLEPMPIARSRFRATVGFSAPELFGRSKQNIDVGADIYSLGAIVYYLVTGIVPPVAMETAFSPALSPRDFRPDFPFGWVETILQATDPVPNRRPASAAELRERLEEGLAHMKARTAYDASPELHANVETHIGYTKARRSPVNQDNVFIAQDAESHRLLMVVGDGVSTATYGSGDLASGFLIDRATEVWEETQALNFPADKVVRSIINRANRDIVDYVNENHSPIELSPSEVMGSTALVALIDQSMLTLASIGDSRCYVIRDEMMECITRDHNLFTLSLVEGVSLEDVLLMPHGDALARCLGTFEVAADGYLKAVDPPTDVYRFRVMPGDNILLCTDGLFDYAGATYEESEQNIREHVLGEDHPGLACLELIVLANRGGGGDNIGVGIIKVHASSPDH